MNTGLLDVSDRRQRVLCLALLLDLALGDPPNRFHPVAWMGAGIAAAQARAPRQGRLTQLGYGVLLSAGGTLIAAGLGWLLAWTVTHLPGPLGWLAEASLLKLTFSLRDLSSAAEQIESALAAQDLPEAQYLLSWHLVSRDTSTLDESQVAAATIESVAENTSDGLVAPLLYYVRGGLPAALGYRFVNTADAMLGYRDQAHEWLGKSAARLDDLANLLPARVTAGLFFLAAVLIGEDARRGWRIWRRDAGKTASPNAGHPISAMAGVLGLELEKVGHYRLGVGQRSPGPRDIDRAVRLIRLVPLLITGWLIILSASRSSR